MKRSFKPCCLVQQSTPHGLNDHHPLHPLSYSYTEGAHVVFSLRFRSGTVVIKLVLAGDPEIWVLPESHFQHDRPYLG